MTCRAEANAGCGEADDGGNAGGEAREGALVGDHSARSRGKPDPLAHLSPPLHPHPTTHQGQAGAARLLAELAAAEADRVSLATAAAELTAAAGAAADGRAFLFDDLDGAPVATAAKALL